ncbi:uncharacterized protein C3orf62 [Astyanax mexicanus]|uniref:uncharacterized protein C3orf62 n=1 Tax=Astyanax mexicanus TaxID=7994 RepID=UPI0020CAAC72|nr:uncharacterized protein C3orf62 [Astyanax mexicanus]
MPTQLRQYIQGLSAARDHEYCSPASHNTSEPVIYVSPQYIIGHTEILHDCGLCPVYHNVMFRHSERPDCRPACLGSKKKSEGAVPQNCDGLLEASSLQTLEELLAKLEFENELNRVCGNLRVSTNTQSSPLPSDRGSYSTESADSGVEEGEDSEEDTDGEEDVLTGLLDMVLEMEQDYDLYF